MRADHPKAYKSIQCTAQRSNGQGQCKCRAIAGGNVCKTHGGSAPQVKAAAAARIQALVDPALGVLAKAMKEANRPKGTVGPVGLQAAKDILDRAGHGAKQKIEVSLDEKLAERVVAARKRSSLTLGGEGASPVDV